MDHLQGKKNFFSKYKGLSDEEYTLELLYAQKIIHGKLHKIRATISTLKWLLATLIIIGILIIGLMLKN